MILRCCAPRKSNPCQVCDQFIGVLADGATVLGRIHRSDERTDRSHWVMRCGCGALWEVAPAQEYATA